MIVEKNSGSKKDSPKKDHMSYDAESHNHGDKKYEGYEERNNSYPYESDYDVDENDFDQRKDEYKNYKNQNSK